MIGSSSIAASKQILDAIALCSWVNFCEAATISGTSLRASDWALVFVDLSYHHLFSRQFFSQA
jgi:hypothetical protein